MDGGCDRLLSSFWAEIGSIDKHYRGELKPSQEWIGEKELLVVVRQAERIIDAEVAYFRQRITEQEIGHHNQKVVTYNEGTGEVNVFD